MTRSSIVHIQHAHLAPERLEFRGYQANLARIAGEQDTLVVLPTGLGKTVVAALAMADAIKAGAKRILLMAPTKPLVEQHGQFFAEALLPPWNEVHVLTGNVTPAKREAAYKAEGLVIATPQVIQNDLIANRHLGDVDWVIYDEAHRAIGDYPYVFIGETLAAHHPSHRRMGLTASPGHDPAKIDAVRASLGLEHVEIRTPQDPDVVDFIQDVKMEWETLPLPPTMGRVRERLEAALHDRVQVLRKSGVLTGKANRRTLLDASKDLQRRIKSTSDPEAAWFNAMSQQAQAMKLLHALEMCQTQGSAAFAQYMDGLRKEAEEPKASKATRLVASDSRVNEAYQIARHDTSENPKLGRVEVLVREQIERHPNSRVIVFTHFRTTCASVGDHLATLPGVRATQFVGQGKRKGQDGLSQKQQAEMLEQFRDGTFNTLVATSVAEEGLDIPSTDLVVFYEPVPSEIRSIQRRGRTGRNAAGRVIVLMTKGTQDEAAHWSARRKEQEMVQGLLQLRHRLAGGTPAPRPVKQATLSQPSLTEGPHIVVDSREKGGVVKHLSALGAHLDMKSLDTADYILSDRIAVERKTGADFVDSLVDGRLFDQLKRLKDYPKPILLIEGSLNGHRNVAPEALSGAIASTLVDYGIPILQTADDLETARFLVSVAKREQGREGRKVAVRGSARSQEHPGISVLCGLPSISTLRAEALLKHFGNLADVLAASESELANVDGVGPASAASIRRALHQPFTETVE